jgi:hypothetical protein
MNIWLKTLASILYPIFSRPYTDEYSYTQRIINGKNILVQRPNHGFLYSMRQALLAYNICQMLNYDSDNVKKIMLLSSLQRSGREAEISNEEFPDLYRKYEIADTMIFKKEAAKHSYLFSSTEEIDQLSQALHWKSESFISKIIRTAHILDLRRIPSFDMIRVKKDACMCLFGNLDDQNKKVIDKLFDYAGVYLDVTGDRDAIKGKEVLSDRFFVLSTNNELCADTLCKIISNYH